MNHPQVDQCHLYSSYNYPTNKNVSNNNPYNNYYNNSNKGMNNVEIKRKKTDSMKNREKQAIVNFLNLQQLHNNNTQEIFVQQQKQVEPLEIIKDDLPQLIKINKYNEPQDSIKFESLIETEHSQLGKYHKYKLSLQNKFSQDTTHKYRQDTHYRNADVDASIFCKTKQLQLNPLQQQKQPFSLNNNTHLNHSPSTPASSSTSSPPIHQSSKAFDDVFISPTTTQLPHTLDQLSPTSKSSLKPPKRVSEGVCAICGDHASGYHYNALSCEGCKGFFRRTVTRKLSYKCKFSEGNCKMDMWMRRKCPFCRLKKCYEEGMKEDCLLTEHQCSIRNSRRRAFIKKECNAISRTQKTSGSADNEAQADEGGSGKDILMLLVEEQRELVERVVELQDQYELPSNDDLKLLSNPADKQFENDDERIEAFFVFNIEMTILVTRLIVQFTKNLPGFKNLHREDQIVLLKASSSEVMILRAARRYDPVTDSIIFGNEMPFSLKDMDCIGMREGAVGMFEFSRAMSHHSVDNSEYGLLIAICIFSLRPGLKQAVMVEKLQDVYTEVLCRYVMLRRGKGHRVYLAHLLMKLSLLRTIGFHHNHFLYKLTLRIGSLPPLLKEYFDI